MSFSAVVDPSVTVEVALPARDVVIALPIGATEAGATLSIDELVTVAAEGIGLGFAVAKDGTPINLLPPPDFARQRSLATVSKVVEIEVRVAGKQVRVLAQPITITISYDPAAFPLEASEGDLALFFFDTTTRQWQEVPGSVVDATTRQVSAEVTHLTPFAIMAKLPLDKQVSPVQRFFGATRHYISFGFLAFFEATGDVERWGYPRTEEVPERGLTVQWFQRGRVEWHPQLGQVLLGLVGDEVLDARQLGAADPRLDQPPAPALYETDEDFWYFPETGFAIRGEFLRYFETHGGLELFGYPVTQEIEENGFQVQWFQRARMEWHPELGVVQLGLLGDELLDWRRRAVSTAQSLALEPPWLNRDPAG